MLFGLPLPLPLLAQREFPRPAQCPLPLLPARPSAPSCAGARALPPRHLPAPVRVPFALAAHPVLPLARAGCSALLAHPPPHPTLMARQYPRPTLLLPLRTFAVSPPAALTRRRPSLGLVILTRLRMRCLIQLCALLLVCAPLLAAPLSLRRLRRHQLSCPPASCLLPLTPSVLSSTMASLVGVQPAQSIPFLSPLGSFPIPPPTSGAARLKATYRSPSSSARPSRSPPLLSMTETPTQPPQVYLLTTSTPTLAHLLLLPPLSILPPCALSSNLPRALAPGRVPGPLPPGLPLPPPAPLATLRLHSPLEQCGPAAPAPDGSFSYHFSTA